MGSAEHKGTALITGASSGIGTIYADRLARRGYDLILVARNAERLRVLTTRLSDSTGRAVEIINVELTNVAGLAHVETVLRTDASIVMLVNSAEVGATGPVGSSSVARMNEIIALNVLALTRLTYAVVPAFVSRGTGTIINISSIAALIPEAGNGVYGGSKAFVLALSRSLHHELAGQGIRIQAVLPGATATEFWSLMNTPAATLMPADDMVDAALVGLDQGELVTIPSLPEMTDWAKFEATRWALMPNLSHNAPAARYGVNPHTAA